jgi:hypothetical protein
MNEQEFRSKVKDFERVIEKGERFAQIGDQLGHGLAVLFAMKSAYAICTSLLNGDSEQTDALNLGKHGERCYTVPPNLPKLANVRAAVPRLIDAAVSKSKTGISLALRDSGVADLCPTPYEQLLRLDVVGRIIKGRALQVSLVELSLFAVEIGDLLRASKYVAEALKLVPTAWELHNLCVLDGLFSLKAGHVGDAVHSLNKSISACLVDEYTSLDCGVRAPNFMLAQEFLEHNDPGRVVTYLSQCKNIWHSFRLPIGELIGLVESGEYVNLQACEFVGALNQHSYKLQMQWMRARCLEEAAEPSPDAQIPKSPEEIAAARVRLVEDCQRSINDRVKNAIKYLDTNEWKP